MFLIRTAFWLSLVILLLPAGTAERDDGGESMQVDVSAMDALGAARDTMNDLSAFCLRNPDTCATGSAALRAFGQKAQSGARLVYEYLGELDEGEQLAHEALPPTAAEPQNASGTLKTEDLEIPWRGPEANI